MQSTLRVMMKMVAVFGGLWALPLAAETCEEKVATADAVISFVGNWSDFGGAVGSAKADGLGKAMKGAELATMAAQSMCKCIDAADTYGCAKQQLADNFLCILATLSGAPNPNNPYDQLPGFWATAAASALYDIIADPDDPYCDGNGTVGGLKCCKYEPEQVGCHTAFNHPDPINCEGAIRFGYHPESFGLCMMLPISGMGCVCNHIPECVAGETADQSAYAIAHRRALWFGALSKAYKNAFSSDGNGVASSCDLDFGLFIGCRGWLDVARGAAPYVLLQDFETLPQGSVLTDLNYSVVGNAALRVMLAIPNGLERYDYVAARAWSEREIGDYLGGVDPSIELKQWLTECGLQLLQASLPKRWKLLAVPYPGETPSNPRPTGPAIDGCQVGAPPADVMLRASIKGADLAVEVEVADPEVVHDTEKVNPVLVDWGDDTVSSHTFDHNSPQNVFSHRYARAGTHTVRATYTNSAGLSKTVETTVTPTQGAAVDQLRYITGVSAATSLISAAPSFVDVFVEDARGQLHLLRRDQAPSTGGTMVPLTPDYVESTHYPLAAQRLVWKISVEADAGKGIYFIDGLAIELHRSRRPSRLEELTLTPQDFTSSDPSASAKLSNGAIGLPLIDGLVFTYELPQN